MGLSVAVTLTVAGFAFYSRALAPAGDESFVAGLDEATASLASAASESYGPSYDLSAHQTLSRVIILIKENYVDPERIRPYEMFLAALDYVQKTVAEVIVDTTQAPNRITVVVDGAEQVFDLERLGGLDQLWEVTLALRDIFRFIEAQISDAKRQKDIEYAAINGMLSALDPHSILLKPESFDEVKLSTKGEFGGLGIVIAIRDGVLTVVSPIEGTPASRAGLKAKDVITKIGEDSTVNMALDEAVQRLRGKPGTRISVWVLRKGWPEARRYNLTRANIKIESVASQLLARGVGYVKIKSFQNNTFDDLHTHLERLRRKNQTELRGLILDLRNNPGGLLDQAILVSDRFLDHGPIVITVGEGARRRDVKSAHSSGTEARYPMAVLVNAGSASASEIVAGALKNQERALVIGQQTFGKGSVQVLYDFKDRSALKLTIAQYLTPGDLSIQSVGIVPDVAVVHATIQSDVMHMFVEDDSLREKDLERHLERPVAVTQGADEAPGDRGEGDQRLYAANARTPVRQIVHLSPKTEEVEPAEESEEQPPTFVSDFEIELAQEVLAKATRAERTGMLQDAASLFDARAAEQEAIIVRELDKLGVDWRDGKAGGAPRVEVSLTREGSGEIKAGSSFTLVATVRNSGAGPLYRCFGVTESPNPQLDRLEFVFGAVPPGQQRSWRVPVKLPHDLHSRTDQVMLSLGDLHGAAAGQTAALIVSTTAAPQPRFAYVYQLDDQAGGNGDGLLQTGEEIVLRLRVHNLGQANAVDTVVTARAPAAKGIFLKQGRSSLGTVKAGASAEGALSFAVKSTDEPARVRLTMWDNESGAVLSDEVELLTAPASRGQPARGVARVKGGEEATVYAGAAASAPVLGWLKPGVVVRTRAVLGEWTRISLDGRQEGFVAQSALEAVTGGGRKPTANPLRSARPQAAPVIALVAPPPVIQEPTVRLRANVSDERFLRDLFIFVNDTKVFYRSLKELKPAADGSVSTAIDVPITLKAGSNTIAVVARESEELVERAIVGVYHPGGQAVADRGLTQP